MASKIWKPLLIVGCVIVLLLGALFYIGFIHGTVVIDGTRVGQLFDTDRHFVQIGFRENITNDDIARLGRINGMTYLAIWSSGVTDISAVSEFTDLTELYLHDNQITDIAPVSNLTGLERLQISGNPITNLAPLSNLTNLRMLGLTIDPSIDFAPVTNLSNLTQLSFRFSVIEDFSILHSFPRLSIIEVVDSDLSDLEPLVEALLAHDGWMQNESRTLVLNSNQISDLSPLAALPAYTSLFIRYNPLTTDLSPVEHLDFVDVRDW